MAPAARTDAEALVERVAAEQMIAARAGELELARGVFGGKVIVGVEIGFVDRGMRAAFHRFPIAGSGMLRWNPTFAKNDRFRRRETTSRAGMLHCNEGASGCETVGRMWDSLARVNWRV